MRCNRLTGPSLYANIICRVFQYHAFDMRWNYESVSLVKFLILLLASRSSVLVYSFLLLLLLSFIQIILLNRYDVVCCSNYYMLNNFYEFTVINNKIQNWYSLTDNMVVCEFSSILFIIKKVQAFKSKWFTLKVNIKHGLTWLRWRDKIHLS